MNPYAELTRRTATIAHINDYFLILRVLYTTLYDFKQYHGSEQAIIRRVCYIYFIPKLMKEIVSLHVGQFGNRVGQQIWSQLAAEHSINQSGQQKDEAQGGLVGSFFEETNNGLFTPKAAMIDPDPDAIEELRLTNRFRGKNLVSGKEGASSLYSRGSYYLYRTMKEEVYDVVRRLAQSCDYLDSFMIYSALGGGSGSGFRAMMEIQIRINYPKKTRINLPLLPSRNYSDSVVEYYNTILCMKDLLRHSDMIIPFQNQQLYQICERSLGIQAPTYLNANSLIAQAVSHITAPMRFSYDRNVEGFRAFQTNLIAYPKMKVISSALSNHYQQSDPTKLLSENQLLSMAKDLVNREHQLVDLNLSTGKYMSGQILYSGKGLSQPIIASALSSLKAEDLRLKQVDWNPVCLKSSICQVPSIQPSAAMLTNHTGTCDPLQRISWMARSLYEKRSFCWWYCYEGLEQFQFSQGIETTDALCRDYAEAQA